MANPASYDSQLAIREEARTLTSTARPSTPAIFVNRVSLYPAATARLARLSGTYVNTGTCCPRLDL